jgi:hypothetical protein
MKITKQTLARLIKEELQSVMDEQKIAQKPKGRGFQMDPHALQSHPEGEPQVGPEYTYGLSDEELAQLGANPDLYPETQDVDLEADEEFDFADGDDVEVRKGISSVSPVSEPRLYTNVRENKVSKELIERMILEELKDLQEVGIPGVRMSRGGQNYWGYNAPKGSLPGYNWVEGGNVQQPDGSIKYVPGHYAGHGSNLKSPRGARRPRSASSRHNMQKTGEYLGYGALALGAGALVGGIGSAIASGMQKSRSNRPDPAAPSTSVDDVALDLYKSMKGAGTDEEYIVRAIQAFSNPRKIKVLNSAYNQVLRRYRDTKDGDLAQWLKDDGMDEESDIVRDLLKR